MNKITRFTWDEWKWMVIIVLLGINMYWTAFNIAPNQQQLQEAAETQQQIKDRATQATQQNNYIIQTINNNSRYLEELITNQQNISGSEKVLLVNIDRNVSDMRNVLYLTEVKPNQTLIEALIEKEMREFVAELKQNLSRNDNDT